MIQSKCRQKAATLQEAKLIKPIENTASFATFKSEDLLYIPRNGIYTSKFTCSVAFIGN